MNLQISNLWNRPATIVAIAMGLGLSIPAAHAQCGKMAPRGAVVWSALPENVAPSLRLTIPRSGHVEKSHDYQYGQPSIVGMWKVTFTSGGQVVDQAFETFHDDGTELMIDTAPPATDNVCSGVWARIDGVNFKLNHPSWTFDGQGNLTGTAVIKVNVLLDANSNKFSGTFTVDVMNNSGTVLEHLTGSVSAERVTVD